MSKEVAKSAGTAVAAFDDDMMAEAAALGGAGRTKAVDDNVVPFLSLLQDMSPEVKKRDPEYVDGAEPGFILNKATRRLYNPDTGVLVQPWATDRCINEWIPRENGGGFQGRHPLTGDPDSTMADLGATRRPDPKDPKKFDWILPSGNQLIDTRYVYVNEIEVELDADGNIVAFRSATPAVISFSSTGHTSAKKWSTLRNNSTLPGGKEHPIWFKMYRMVSKPAKNTKGDFFVLDFVDMGDQGWVKDPGVRAKAKELYESWQKGNVRTNESADAPSEAGASSDESPI